MIITSFDTSNLTDAQFRMIASPLIEKYKGENAILRQNQEKLSAENRHLKEDIDFIMKCLYVAVSKSGESISLRKGFEKMCITEDDFDLDENIEGEMIVRIHRK